MMKNRAEWAFESGKITKIGPSEGCCAGAAGFLVSPLAKTVRKPQS